MERAYVFPAVVQHSMLRFILLGLSYFLLFPQPRLAAQWKNLAPNLINTTGHFGGGAIIYSSGNLWAAITNVLWMSSDEGKTWQTVKTPLESIPAALISDIDFYDKNNGFVSTLGNGACVTHDGGASWNMVTPPAPGIFVDGKFVGSPQKIAAYLVGAKSQLYLSVDGGIVWNVIGPPAWSGPGSHGSVNVIVVKKKDNSINLLDYQGGDNSQIFSTVDEGVNWTNTPGVFRTDCYQFTYDPCDDKAIYIVNEGTVQVEPDQKGRIVSTRNSGATFSETNLQSLLYYSGSLISCPAGTLYAQTQTPDGVIRSTDGGLTWKSIGGPFGLWDCHFICAKNDNTLFALDTFGGVWKTTNSGGDSLKGLPVPLVSLSADTLFAQDSLTLCDPPLDRLLKFTISGCSPPRIVKTEIAGPDAASFTLIPISGNSFGATFKPQKPGLQIAYLVVTLSDGVLDTVLLQGYERPTFTITLATKDQATDTVGGTITVPITIQNLDKQHDFELVMHYSPDLIYNNSYSLTGTPLDKPGEQWLGRSKLKITGVQASGLQGYANFSFTDSVATPKVWFDSLVVLDQASPCEYIGMNVATSVITAPSGCGVRTISDFLRTGRLPQFTIAPNPTQNILSIGSSNNLKDVRIELFDLIGRQSGSLESLILTRKERSLIVDLSSFRNGIYFLRIESGGFVRTSPLIINH